MSSQLENSKACWPNSLHNGTGNFWQITGNFFYGDQERLKPEASESANSGREVAHREPRGYTSTRARVLDREQTTRAPAPTTLAAKRCCCSFRLGAPRKSNDTVESQLSHLRSDLLRFLAIT